MDSWLCFRNVSFSYGDTPLLENLEVEVTEQEPVLVLFGPSGVGKTTLVKLCAGHLLPDQGVIEICGERVRGPSAQRPVVFQEYCLFPWMTVLENVGFGLKCAGVPREERQRRSWKLLQNLNLSDTGHLYPKELSGGMKQRVGLARALVVLPQVILMDEPFNALDSEIKATLLQETTRLVADRQARLLIVTHDLHDAIFLGNRISILHGPSEVSVFSVGGPPHPRPLDYLYSRPFMEESRRFREALNHKTTLESHGSGTDDTADPDLHPYTQIR